MHRRSFLTVCGAASLSAACARLSTVAGQLDEGRMVVDRREFAARDGVLVEHPSLAFPIYVHHRGGEEFTAVLTRCMHRGCTVEPADGRLVCPCHGSEYSLAGVVLKGPTELPLHTFQVRAEADRLYILDIDRGPK